MSSPFDYQMMTLALRMAARGLGDTWPNPSVGAVIADEDTGEVIARGRTASRGRPHAEAVAIAAAGSRAKDATIYVTLEPCSHQGMTGPCADAIIAAGLKRAVVAIEDPDPRVAGRGLDRLRAAGLFVERGVGANEARWITRGHIVRVTERRPLVTLKLALDRNGDIAEGTGRAPRWVTGAAARAHGQLLRAQSDAILVGSGTVRADDPLLTCRLPGLESRSPVRVVLSGELEIDAASKVVRSARAVPVYLVCGFGVDVARQDALAASGAEIINTTKVAGRLWLPAVMEALVARGITRLLVEGGPHIWRAFAAASLVDEVVLYMAGARDESSARAALARQLGAAPPLKLHDTRTFDTDTMWRFRRAAREG